MPGQRKYIFIALIVVALGLLIFQDRIEDLWQHTLNRDSRPIIGHIDELQGDVKFRKPDTLTTTPATNGMNLHLGDTLLTEEGATATVIFNSGLHAEIEPQSVVVIQNENSEMTFIKGRMKILNVAPGLTLPPENIAKKDEKESNPEKAFQQTPQPEEKPDEKLTSSSKDKFVEQKNSLPNAYITNIIRSQKTFLNRCYVQHLRTDPDAKGKIETSITIEPDGNISTARVIASSIADPQLQQCIVSTLQRAKFKTFTGDPIIVTYPINFD
jgi:hypothetical protein